VDTGFPQENATKYEQQRALSDSINRKARLRSARPTGAIGDVIGTDEALSAM
jgi:hypothetical protein